MELNEFDQVIASVHAIAKNSRRQERELNEKNRQAEHDRHEQRMREIRDAHKKAVEQTLAAYQQPTPVEKRRRAIAYRLQAAIKALVQEWGGKDVYDYQAVQCQFGENRDYSNLAVDKVDGVWFGVYLPFKEPSEPME